MNAPAPAKGEAVPPGYRDVRMAGDPRVSLVVVAERDVPLASALAGLAAECGGRGVELIAAVHADQLGEAEATELEAAFPGVRFVWAADALTPAALRERGLAAADGDIVLFADGAAAEPGWLDRRLGGWAARSAFPLRGGIVPPAVLTTASTRSAE